MGSSDVVWRLGNAPLVVGAGAAARRLAEKMIAGSNGPDGDALTDFVHLLGSFNLFTGGFGGSFRDV
jgi:hypothetical protein